MTVSIVNGRVESAELRRTRGDVSLYRTITLQPDNGPAQTIKNAVVTKTVAAELSPGAEGRFYLHKVFDQKGIHGVRTPDGRSVYGFAGANKKWFLFVAVAAMLWIALRASTEGEVPFLGILLLILGVVGSIVMARGEREAKAQFHGDAIPGT